MIEWTATKDKMPTGRGEYLLYNEKEHVCVGPVPWLPDEQGGGAWVDIFATPEAGQMYSPPTVSHWAVWNDPKGAE